jgi:hypothetical protein
MTDSSLLPALERAKDVLARLELQAASYPVTEIPVHLQIEIEEQRKKIIELEAAVQSAHPSPASPTPASSPSQAASGSTIVQGNNNTVVGAGGIVVKGDVKGDVVTGEKRVINTGGGTYFEHFDGNFISKDQNIQIGTQINLAGEPTPERFLELLQALRQTLSQTGLPPEEQAEVQDDLERVAQQTVVPKPNRNIILKRLDNVVNFLANAATLATAAPHLIQWGRMLLEWAKTLFP